ncbi:YtpI family protein [Paenibacillus marinisediminis]
MEILQQALIVLICIASISSLFFSIRSRRSTDMRLRGLFGARTNISMGAMLIFMALVQMVMFTGSSIRVIVGSVLLCIGLFNLFVGLRNHGYFSRLQQ